ncbi:MAG: hypothetical protein P8X50_09860 [Maritimibacter sp.]
MSQFARISALPVEVVENGPGGFAAPMTDFAKLHLIGAGEQNNEERDA